MPDLGLTSTWGATDWAPLLIQALGLESAVALGGVRLIPIAGRDAYLPRLLVDPEADWVAELAELPSDAGDADTIHLTPRKIGNVTVLSTESVEDAPISELDAVAAALIRGVAKKVDARFFSADAATAIAPAGIFNGTLPGTSVALDIEALTRAVGAVGAAGGRANVVWLNPDDLTDLRVEALQGGFPISDPTAPGIEAVAGARLVPTPALTAGTAVAADSRYVLAGVRRDARVDFSAHSSFTADGIAARVTMRCDWAVADPDAVYVIQPAAG